MGSGLGIRPRWQQRPVSSTGVFNGNQNRIQKRHDADDALVPRLYLIGQLKAGTESLLKNGFSARSHRHVALRS